MEFRHLQQRTLGRSGLLVSTVGLGCNNFGGRIGFDASRDTIHAALDAGITLFDTADVYGNRGGSEEILGRVLGERRRNIVLASKFGIAMDEAGREKGGSRSYILRAVEASLRRLKTDWLDLYQYHRPDEHTPTEETLRALDDLVRSGKVRYVGCSNMPAWRMADSQWVSSTKSLTRFVSCQDEYSLLHRSPEKELIPAAEAFGMGLLPYFPLASGLLTGKYRRNQPRPTGTRLTNDERLATIYLTGERWEKAEKLAEFCDARGRTLVELAFSWLLSRPVVSSVIAGATAPAQVTANVAAAGWMLSPEDLAAIDAIAPA